MEVFIFMRIKNLDTTLNTKPTQLVASQITIKFLDNDANLALSLARFDAAKAKCRYDRDRQRLVAVIEASFGTAAAFNQLVLEVLDKQVLGLKEASRSRRSTRRKSRMSSLSA